jgi:isopentenyldiphosphate isomerase
MKVYPADELFPIVDENGNAIGEALRSICHDGKSMLLHPVVHLFLFNSKGELFLQKRASTKDIQPGKWDTSVGGHMSPGESVSDALARETSEELGIRISTPVFMGRHIWQSARERELVSSFSTISDAFPEINKEEIEEGKFWTLKEIKLKIPDNIFTPNFVHEFEVFISQGSVPLHSTE